MKVQLLVRTYNQMIGLARYTESLCNALSQADVDYSLVEPAHPLALRSAHSALRPLGLDLQTFFSTYPLTAHTNSADLTHLTAQQMATLLWFKPKLGPTLVTVHDIVPFLVRQDQEQSTFRHPMDHWFDRLAMAGLKRASTIISVSHFTKQTLIDTLAIPNERVHVVYEGVDHTIFNHRQVPKTFYDRYQLDDQGHYVLYVGSENPRKNLPRLLSAFAKLREAIPQTKLIKIGSIEYLPQAEDLHRQVREMGLSESVIFVEHVPDEDLAQFYNLADLFVFPSLLEGFGLPVLEAMACGTPVVTSNCSSLPEVAGEAALLVDPYDVGAIEKAMFQVLCDPNLAAELRERGLKRAKEFTWENTARETVKIYERVLGGDLDRES